MRRIYLTSFLSVFLTFAISAAAGKEYTVITVKKGETLTKIAKKYLDNPRRWRELLRYNKISNPNLIYPGRKLKVPAYLAKKPVAEVVFRKGQSEVKPNGTTSWVGVETGKPLFPKDLVRTGSKSRVVMLFGGSTKVVLSEKAYLEVSSKVRGGVQAGVQLRRGRLQAFVNKVGPGKKYSPFRVVSPSAVAGTRGTVFLADVNDGGDTLIACYEGKMAVSAQGVTVEVPAGYSSMVKKGEKPSQPRKLLPPPLIKLAE